VSAPDPDAQFDSGVLRNGEWYQRSCLRAVIALVTDLIPTAGASAGSFTGIGHLHGRHPPKKSTAVAVSDDLKEVLESEYGLALGTWVLIEAFGGSADGIVVVGYGYNIDNDVEG